jgi:hypothetical protein
LEQAFWTAKIECHGCRKAVIDGPGAKAGVRIREQFERPAERAFSMAPNRTREIRYLIMK